jgi:uncharacterized membrane protein
MVVGLRYENVMRSAAIAAALLLLQGASAVAQIQPAPKPKAGAPTSKTAEPAKPSKNCAEYGAGFVAVEGTASCVQVRGYIRIQGSGR